MSTAQRKKNQAQNASSVQLLAFHAQQVRNSELTLDAGPLDHLNVLETRENVASHAEPNLDTVLDALLDREGVLLDLCKLLFGLLEVDRDASARCCWRY